jgi:hypothetical protein
MIVCNLLERNQNCGDEGRVFPGSRSVRKSLSWGGNHAESDGYTGIFRSAPRGTACVGRHDQLLYKRHLRAL